MDEKRDVPGVHAYQMWRAIDSPVSSQILIVPDPVMKRRSASGAAALLDSTAISMLRTAAIPPWPEVPSAS